MKWFHFLALQVAHRSHSRFLTNSHLPNIPSRRASLAMSTHSSPPPLPDPDQLRKKLQSWRWVSRLGVVLAAAPVGGLLVAAFGMLRTFGSMEGDIATSAHSISGGVSLALLGTRVGFALCPIGVVTIVLTRRRMDPLRAQLAALAAAEAAPDRSA